MSIQLYNEMLKAGYFDPKSNNYLWIREMEWIDPEQTEKYKEDVPETAVPIAVNGAGDVWVIEDNAVILYCHDDDEPMFYADSLINAVFRAIIEYLSDNNFVSDDPNDEDNAEFAKKYIADCISIFSDRLSEGQISDIRKIAENHINEYHYTGGTAYHSFMSVEEADEIIKKYVVIPHDPDADNTEKNTVSEENMEFLDLFSEESIEQLASHCRELSKKHLKSGKKFMHNIPAENSFSSLLYKNVTNDLFLYCLGDIFTNGKFSVGTKKKTGSEVKGDCTEYFIDADGKPVYAKLYVDGNMNPNYGFCFYFVTENSVISAEYLYVREKDEYKYCYTTENTYDSNGRLLSFVKFDGSSISTAEFYMYENGVLTESRSLGSFEYNEKIGKIIHELFPDELTDNPMNFSKNIYNYKDSVIAGVHQILHNDYGYSCYDYDVPEKIYKEVLKKRLI